MLHMHLEHLDRSSCSPRVSDLSSHQDQLPSMDLSESETEPATKLLLKPLIGLPVGTGAGMHWSRLMPG